MNDYSVQTQLATIKQRFNAMAYTEDLIFGEINKNGIPLSYRKLVYECIMDMYPNHKRHVPLYFRIGYKIAHLKERIKYGKH